MPGRSRLQKSKDKERKRVERACKKMEKGNIFELFIVNFVLIL